MDIIERLRFWAAQDSVSAGSASRCEEAANEIERLRAALEYYADHDGAGKDYIICDNVTRGRISDVHALGEKARTALRGDTD